MRRSKGCKRGLKPMNKDYIQGRCIMDKTYKVTLTQRGGNQTFGLPQPTKKYDGHGEVGFGYWQESKSSKLGQNKSTHLVGPIEEFEVASIADKDLTT